MCILIEKRCKSGKCIMVPNSINELNMVPNLAAILSHSATLPFNMI